MIRRLSRKLGDPWRRGIEGERDLLEAELLEVDREDLLETLLDDRDELEKLLRLCLVELIEDRELLLVRLLFSLSRDSLDTDLDRLRDFFERERLLDFLDSDRLRDFFERDLLLDFLDRERLLDRFDKDLVLLLDLDFSGECEGDFLDRDGDLDVECFDSEEDLDLDNFFGLAGDFSDFFSLQGEAEALCLGEADFLLLEWDRDFLSLDKDLERCLGDLEDLLSRETDLVYDLDGDLE